MSTIELDYPALHIPLPPSPSPSVSQLEGVTPVPTPTVSRPSDGQKLPAPASLSARRKFGFNLGDINPPSLPAVTPHPGSATQVPVSAPLSSPSRFVERLEDAFPLGAAVDVSAVHSTSFTRVSGPSAPPSPPVTPKHILSFESPPSPSRLRVPKRVPPPLPLTRPASESAHDVETPVSMPPSLGRKPSKISKLWRRTSTLLRVTSKSFKPSPVPPPEVPPVPPLPPHVVPIIKAPVAKRVPEKLAITLLDSVMNSTTDSSPAEVPLPPSPLVAATSLSHPSPTQVIDTPQPVQVQVSEPSEYTASSSSRSSRSMSDEAEEEEEEEDAFGAFVSEKQMIAFQQPLTPSTSRSRSTSRSSTRSRSPRAGRPDPSKAGSATNGPLTPTSPISPSSGANPNASRRKSILLRSTAPPHLTLPIMTRKPVLRVDPSLPARKPLSPTMHTGGTISAETGEIVDPESRRLSELAFM